MGCWVVGTGVLGIVPSPDDRLIKEYLKFSRETNPYESIDENFPNPWFFNENNRLESRAGKFGEPSYWYTCVKDFIEKAGYRLVGDTQIVGEGDEGIDFWKLCDIQEEKYKKWQERIESYK